MAESQTKSSGGARTRANEEKASGNGGIPGALPGLEPGKMLQRSALTFEHWIATNQELARFYTERLKKNMKAFDAYSKCRTPQDVVSAAARTASEAVHDYADEFDRVMAINTAPSE